MADAFPKATRRYDAANVGTMVYTLVDRPADGEQPASQKLGLELRFVDAEGRPLPDLTRQFDLEQFSSTAQINQIKAYMATMRTKAQEALP